MKRFLSFRFLLLLVLGAGVLAAMSVLSEESELDRENSDGEHPYGEPDGAVSDGDVSSLVD